MGRLLPAAVSRRSLLARSSSAGEWSFLLAQTRYRSICTPTSSSAQRPTRRVTMLSGMGAAEIGATED